MTDPKLLTISDIENIPRRAQRGSEPIAIDRTEVRRLGEELHPVLWRGRQWAVTEYGIEALSGRYAIDKARIAEDVDTRGWPLHMGHKAWVDVDEFCTAWLVAIALFNVRVPGGAKAIRAALERAAPSRTPDPE